MADDTEATREVFRDSVQTAVQQNAPIGREALLTGWVLIAEWMDHDGDRWLTREQAATTTQWTASGMYHEALHSDWDEDD
jgi:hypothetical protein